jgi:branched-chain amino acid transport system permease protein
MRSALTSFVMIGLFQGALYGLLAVGLVLVYKGARVFNFAQGEFGTVAAFVTFALFSGLGLPYGVAIVGGLLAAVLLGLVVERLVIRPLFNASRTTLLVATVGTALLLIQLEILFATEELTQVLPPILEAGPFNLLGAAITAQQLLAMAVLGVLAVLLALFFSRTNLGLAVLATSQDPLATRIVGVSVTGVSRFIWAFAALLGGVVGIIQAGISFFAPGYVTAALLVPAFTAAVLGGMTSLPGAFIGGIVVGVVQNLGIYFLGDTGLKIPGPSELTLLAVLLLVLAIRPRGLLGTEA